jgi:RNA methyltransferase, TrmH family
MRRQKSVRSLAMIVSRQNRRLKDIRRLKRSKETWALLEGEHLLREALQSAVSIVEVFATPQFLETSEGEALRKRLPIDWLEVSPQAMASLADADSPPGVAALAELPRSGIEALPRLAGRTYVFADGLQDPGNLGALARVAEAVGAAGLVLAPGSTHPNHSRALRASAGSLLRLPVAVQTCALEVDRHLGGIDPYWIALVPRNGTSLYEAEWFGTPIVAIGAEGPGISSDVRARAHLEITIPVEKPVESLNATVAAALTLFEIQRRAPLRHPLASRTA